MTKQEILKKLEAGQYNFEVYDFGIENDNALAFAEDNEHLIELEETEEGIYISTDAIIEAFTKDWTGYEGAGVISVKVWDRDWETVSLTGLEATSSIGSITPAFTYLLEMIGANHSMTTSIGTVSVDAERGVPVTGVEASFATPTLSYAGSHDR